MRLISKEIFRVAAFAILASLRLYAQHQMKPGTVELSAYTGGTFDFPGAGAYAGICYDDFVPPDCTQKLTIGHKALPLLGGGLTVALGKFLWLYGDYAYAFPDRETATASAPAATIAGVSYLPGQFTAKANRQYWMATGGVEFSLPSVHRVVPFARVGGGEVHQSYNSYSVGVNTNPSFIQAPPSAGGLKAGIVGGGIRWYLGERQGIRVEVDGFILGHGIEQAAAPSSGTGADFVSRKSGGRVTVGYFRQFGR